MIEPKGFDGRLDVKYVGKKTTTTKYYSKIVDRIKLTLSCKKNTQFRTIILSLLFNNAETKAEWAIGQLSGKNS